ncbi:MAG: pseudouridine-5'-phosphate glycosidase [Anaerolineales bacterium]|nr:pseudouridine-5'-phosphate glycosidase [Anaerolineales bacterium]
MPRTGPAFACSLPAASAAFTAWQATAPPLTSPPTSTGAGAHVSIIVVCAGAEAILHPPAALEWLETYGVPVIGCQADEFPAFYLCGSGLKLEACADSLEEVAALAHAL